MNKQKKVHVIEKYYLPVTAGIEVNMSETYSKLVEKGWDITIHTSKDTLTEKNILPDFETINEIKVKRYSFGKLGYIPDMDWNNVDYVCLHNFNVFPHFFIMLRVLWLKVTKQKGFSLFLTPHGGFNPEWAVFPKLIGLIKKVYHFTIGTLLINASVDGVRAVSNWEKQEMIRKGISSNKIVVVDNGIEDEAAMDIDSLASQKIKNEVADFGRYIIQIGRVYPIKNYETVIKAMANLPKDLKYIIVGPIELNTNAGYKKRLDTLIKNLDLEDRVKFLGVVKGIDKYYLIKHAQLMVHMALWESFCNVVHEGLSQGLVCIVANNTALPYLIKDGENGYCLETKNSDAVSKKVNFVLENKNTYFIKEMEKRNKEYGLKNSWREVAERMFNFYLSVEKGEKYEDHK
ncbi:glycosyltransferase family 4 protein [Patescibacteria group bacterium]